MPDDDWLLSLARRCFCGNSDEDYKKYGESDACDFACGGDYSETSCGGAWAMDVFSTNGESCARTKLYYIRASDLGRSIVVWFRA